MTVGELIEHLDEYLSWDRKGRYQDRLHVSDGYYLDHTIDCVYYRKGEVVLQSNETDNGNWDLIIPYIIHCLKFFKRDLEVIVMESDDDLDYAYYDIKGFHLAGEKWDDDNKFTLDVSYS